MWRSFGADPKISLDGNNQRIILEYGGIYWKNEDAGCCPTGRATARLVFKGGRFSEEAPTLALAPAQKRDGLESRKKSPRPLAPKDSENKKLNRPLSNILEYEVELSHDDEIFLINGEKFEAQTYCFNMERGDRVVFLDGNPNGACVSAKIFNQRTKDLCEVWCE